MKDLTKGPVGAHVLQLATFIALTTTFQTLYFLADLYFVGRLGKEAIAGVGLAGNLMFLVLALTQSLGVGATSLIAQAIGRKDRERAELVFNQALVLSNLTGLGLRCHRLLPARRLHPLAGRRRRHGCPRRRSIWTGSSRALPSVRSRGHGRGPARDGGHEGPHRDPGRDGGPQHRCSPRP